MAGCAEIGQQSWQCDGTSSAEIATGAAAVGKNQQEQVTTDTGSCISMPQAVPYTKYSDP